MEKYRGSKLSIPEIAKEVNVNFILEGTVTVINKRVKIHAQLIDGITDHHIWGETYERDLTDVFRIQSEIAQIIARKLHLSISPEELKIIDTPPTANLEAYDLYNQARQYQKTYVREGNSILSLGVTSIKSDVIDDLDRAISLYQKAIDLDSTFAQAYSGLGMALALNNMYISGVNTDEHTFDTLISLANKALHFNPQLDEAFLLKGIYYRNYKSRIFEAIENLKKAIDINPSYALAYVELGSIYAWELIDYVEGLTLFQKAYHLDKSDLAPIIMESHYNAFLNVRLFDEADSFRNEFFRLKKNTQQGYYGTLAWTEWCKNDIDASIEWALKAIEEEPGNQWALFHLANRYSYINDFENSLKYLEMHTDLYGINRWKHKTSAHRLAYILYHQGKKEEAEEYFELEIELCKRSIETEDLSATRGLTYYDLFAVYSFLGDFEEAFRHLRSLRQVDFYPAWLMTYFYIDPLLDNVRDDSRFKDFIEEAELKLQREQEMVKTWLDIRDMNLQVSDSGT
jgi:tetratricopeptide (TPR) repeat protein